VISAEKWESVTWDWVEREIVDYLLIASVRPEKQDSLARLLAKRISADDIPWKAGTQQRSTSNG
jgi:hypothetical protein